MFASGTAKSLYDRLRALDPRGATTAEDNALAEELLSDEKERAEHLRQTAIQDAMDVGRVRKIGSVKVTEKMVVERYSHVMHIVSNVEGELKNDKTLIDALMLVVQSLAHQKFVQWK